LQKKDQSRENQEQPVFSRNDLWRQVGYWKERLKQDGAIHEANMLRPKLMLFLQLAPNLRLALLKLAASGTTGASCCGDAT
jgi:hypothetical protein